MVLNSQVPRSVTGYSSGSTYTGIRRVRRRRRNRLLLTLVVLVGFTLFVVYYWKPWVEPNGNDAPPDQDIRGQAANVTPVEPSTNEPAPEPATRVEMDPVQPKAEVEPPPAQEEPPATRTQERPAAEDARVTRALEAAVAQINAGKPVEARHVLNLAYNDRSLATADAQHLREALTQVNEILVFSPLVAEGDPLAVEHVVQRGELLSTIAPRHSLTWQFVARINGVDPNRVPEGKKIKLVQGPFHAVVDKSDYRLDLFLGDPSQPGAVYVRSFPVGLGAGDSTPLGRFIVKRGKATNPEWRNPRKPDEYFARDDPKNPIGEYWVGLRGVEEQNKSLSGYGIHGTIEPDSVGRQASMGCVRMLDADVQRVFEMLIEEMSSVTIQP